MTHLYLANTESLGDPVRFAEGYARLPAHRKAKIDRLQNLQSKRQSLGAWLLLERVLGEQGISRQDIELSYTPQGKTFLAHYPALCFNLSHSGDTVMCALSDGEVGCDIEQIRSIDLALADRFFHPKETQQLHALPEDARPQHFLRLWTLKESFLKAVGLGLSMPLREFWVDLAGDVPQIRQTRFPDQVFFCYAFSETGMHGAACSKTEGFAPPQWITL